MATLSELEQWFSAERLAPYRAICDGETDTAAALYLWNAEMSAALWHTLGHVEVLLRNALHEALTEWSRRRYGHARWYTAVGSLINERTAQDIADARRRATRNGRAETPGRVVAELNLGFWRYLLARRYDGTLWRFCLHRAFSGQRRSDVERVASELHLLRNRIGHHEPLHNRDIPRRLRDALRLAGWINPDTREWIATADTTSQLLEKRPQIHS